MRDQYCLLDSYLTYKMPTPPPKWGPSLLSCAQLRLLILRDADITISLSLSQVSVRKIRSK